MKAWHFAQDDMKLGYKDGRKIRVGKTLKHKGKLVMCESGLHASAKILDALSYARGNMICRVELGGEIVRGDDKCVASERTCLWVVSGEKLLRKFACMCALDVTHLWDAPEIVVRYLKTQDESIRDAARDAAGYAAWDAAGSAAWDAARDAARCAAWYAARDAAGYAAGYAAWDAARDAAGAAARCAAKAKQEKRLLRMVYAERRK